MLNLDPTIDSGLGITAHTETHTHAEMLASHFTNCPTCQAGLVRFILKNPNADPDDIEERIECLWETCPDCSNEYQEWSESIECDHGNHGLEDCEDCMNEWAAQNEPEDVILDYPSEWEKQHLLA